MGQTGTGQDWLNDPRAITERSFEMIAREADFSHLPAATHHIAARVIHACGQPELAPHLRIHAGIQPAAERALARQAPVLCDVMMVRAGIMRRLLPRESMPRCLINEAETLRLARREGITRSAAAVRRWRLLLAGAICLIGNAPTALFTLLEMLRAGAPRPAVVLAFPVGFIGAAESKQAFAEFAGAAGLPFATMLGRPGGAGMAAAALNAMLLRAQA